MNGMTLMFTQQVGRMTQNERRGISLMMIIPGGTQLFVMEGYIDAAFKAIPIQSSKSTLSKSTCCILRIHSITVFVLFDTCETSTAST